MSLIGTTIPLERSGKVKVLSFFASGGEANLYLVKHLKSKTKGVLKVFQDTAKKTQRDIRTKFLVDLDLNAMGSLFAAPNDWIKDSKLSGHFTPLIEGCTMQEHLGTDGADYFENLKMAVALAYGISGMHNLNVAHGDIQIQNILVQESRGKFIPTWIDFDNFNAPSIPAPFCYGQEFYMAPEQREGWHSDTFRAPDKRSDIFSLAAVLHELLLGKMLASGKDNDQTMFNTAMASGIWIHDPARNPQNLEGKSSRILNQNLCRLFRKSVSTQPDERPTALEWAQHLETSLSEIFIHDRCSGPVFIDPSQRICPYCNTPYPTLKLVFTNPRAELAVTSNGMPLGRAQLKSDQVSRNHALLKKVGPETRLESFGSNGTYTKAKKKWIRLADRTSIPISKGQTLRFGDVECFVEET